MKRQSLSRGGRERKEEGRLQLTQPKIHGSKVAAVKLWEVDHELIIVLRRVVLMLSLRTGFQDHYKFMPAILAKNKGINTKN